MTIIIPNKKFYVGLNPKIAALVALVKKTIAENPFALDGYLWAARSQKEWASLLAVAIATFRRFISKPPFVRDRTHNAEGYPVTVLRIGTAGKKTPRHLANIMAKIFAKKTKRHPDRRGYGCLIGCAEIWPEGYQIEIFKLVMNDWPTFMNYLRLALDIERIKSSKPKVYAKPVPYLKWQYPHLPTLRLGAEVAVKFYQMRMQEKATQG